MKRLLAGMALACVLAVPAARAQSDAIRSEFAAALRDAQSSQTVGPARIVLAGEALLQLPPDHVFVPMPAAARLVKAMGNTPDPHLVGLIFPGHQDNWMMAVQYEKTGHIRDDDARDWNVDDLLRSVRAGTERGNEERRRTGLPEIEVLGWAEKPHYDAAKHRLAWAVAARDKGSAQSDEGANYNTYVLGRDGYFKLDLVTDLADLQAQKPAADAILDSLQYLDAKNYSDFNPATDPVADFGLTSLVAGIAAKKLGASALALEWGLHHAKLVLLGVLAVLGLLGYLGWRAARHGHRRLLDQAAAADDFPPTEIAAAALEQPTSVMPRPESSPPSSAPATDPRGPALGSKRSVASSHPTRTDDAVALRESDSMRTNSAAESSPSQVTPIDSPPAPEKN